MLFKSVALRCRALRQRIRQPVEVSLLPTIQNRVQLIDSEKDHTETWCPRVRKFAEPPAHFSGTRSDSNVTSQNHDENRLLLTRRPESRNNITSYIANKVGALLDGLSDR